MYQYTNTLFAPVNRIIDEYSDNPAEIAPLSAEEQAKAKAPPERAARKFKMAWMLGKGGFGKAAWASLLEAIHGFGCALAVARRLA